MNLSYDSKHNFNKFDDFNKIHEYNDSSSKSKYNTLICFLCALFEVKNVSPQIKNKTKKKKGVHNAASRSYNKYLNTFFDE